MAQLTNPFESRGRWYKANLHTHTTSSDGSVSPQARVDQYRRKGYDILALTDHCVTNDLSRLTAPGMLLINGLECHPPIAGTDELYHLVALNLPYGFVAGTALVDARSQIQMIKDAGGRVIVAHPYWIGHNLNELLAIDGYIAIEVFNGTSAKIGKAYSSVHWDDLLDAGRIVPAVAVDDTHKGPDIFVGWTMIRSDSLTVESVMNALSCGCFYSSCGPEILDYRLADGVVSIKCSPVREIHFICNRWHGQSSYAEGSQLLTSAEFKLPPEAKYVRAEIIDPQNNHAWTNPIIV